MPSSHACSLFHLGTGAVLQLANGPISPTTTAAAAALLSAYAVASVVWRVRARYHTAPQIVVGALFGAGSSCVWFAAGSQQRLDPNARFQTSRLPGVRPSHRAFWEKRLHFERAWPLRNPTAHSSPENTVKATVLSGECKAKAPT
mmetsp:Transcript_8037/g.28564  ORF Transcript_8037/g.28564 Transcript_8037/m.28564 type:complete len:145 (+) Transcript_8037:556-990(+)